MKKLFALAIAFAGLAFAQQPIISPSVHGAEWCATLQSLLGPMMPPACQQNVQVDVRSSDVNVTAFVVTISYSDADGSNPRSQTLAGVAHVSVGMAVTSVLFTQDATNIKLISTSATSQYPGDSTTVNAR